MVGHRYSIDVTHSLITATADPNGSWSLTRCTPAGMELCTSMESLCVDVHRWSVAMGNSAPIATITRSLWRFIEPVVAGATMGWSAVCAAPDVWRTSWAPDRGELTLRRISRSECTADADAILQLLRTFTSVSIRSASASLRMVLCSDPADAAVRCDQSDEVVTIVMLATASDDAPSLNEFDAMDMEFAYKVRVHAACFLSLHHLRTPCHHAPQDDGSIRLTPVTVRDDSMQLDATAIYVRPPEAMPAFESDATWNGIPNTRMRRGDSIRADISCARGVGAVHSKYASACGGVSSVLEQAVLTLDVETQGQRPSRAVLAAACDAFAVAVERFSASIDHAFIAPRPELLFPARSIRAAPKPLPPAPGPPTFQCVSCGNGPTTLSTCCKCGKSIMAKMRRRDAVLVLV